MKGLFTGHKQKRKKMALLLNLLSVAYHMTRNESWRYILQESTYGTHIHEDREDRETRFTGLVHDIVTRGGRCLIPVFALGRAQELLLILGNDCFMDSSMNPT